MFEYHRHILMLPCISATAFYDFWGAYGDCPAVESLGAFLVYFESLYMACPDGGGVSLQSTPYRSELGEFDEQIFVDSLIQLVGQVVADPHTQPISRKIFLETLQSAYAAGNGIVSQGDLLGAFVFVDWTPHCEMLFLQDFADAWMIYLLQEPVVALEARYSRFIKGLIYLT